MVWKFITGIGGKAIAIIGGIAAAAGFLFALFRGVQKSGANKKELEDRRETDKAKKRQEADEQDVSGRSDGDLRRELRE